MYKTRSICINYKNPSHVEVNGDHYYHYFKISENLKQIETTRRLCPLFLLVFTVYLDYCWSKLGFTNTKAADTNGKQFQSIVYTSESNPRLKCLPCLFQKHRE